MHTMLTTGPSIRLLIWYPVSMPSIRIVIAIEPIRTRSPPTITRDATASAFAARRTWARRGRISTMPRPHSGAISSAMLQSGVITRPNPPGVPGPNVMTGALGSAAAGVTRL